MALDDKLGASDQKIAFVDRCSIPLSGAVNWTVAQCLAGKIQHEFRNAGFCVPYNICSSETKPFKGAFTSVDADAEPDSLLL
jgi:hypothetical protein